MMVMMMMTDDDNDDCDNDQDGNLPNHQVLNHLSSPGKDGDDDDDYDDDSDAARLIIALARGSTSSPELWTGRQES